MSIQINGYLPPLEEEVLVKYGDEWIAAMRTRYEDRWLWYTRVDFGGYLISADVTEWKRLG